MPHGERISGNTSWSYDWVQWGFDHFPHTSLDKCDYYYYLRYTKGSKMGIDEYVNNLSKSSERCAQTAFNYYSVIKKKHSEFYKLDELEEERLLQIELEKERIKAENQRIENQRLQEIENQRLQEIERQKAIITPVIIPAVVASSALIPLGIIAFLLINSRKGKK